MKLNKHRIEQMTDEEADRLLADLLERRSPDELINARDARTGLTHVVEHLEEAKHRYDNWGKIRGLRTGYTNLDKLTMGLVGGELIVLAGPTSFGKTAVALNVTHKIASKQTPVLFVTLEMTHAEITSRLMKMAEPTDISNLPIFFQLSESLDWRDIPTIMKKAVADGAKLVVVDHLHYLVRGVDNTAAEVGKIVQSFKRAAIKHNVPVLLLAQLRRINDRVDGKRREPDIDDLKESSYIAQDADVVLMVNRTDLDSEDLTVKLLKHRTAGIRKGEQNAEFILQGVKLWEK